MQSIKNPKRAGRKKKLTPLEITSLVELIKNGDKPKELIAYEYGISMRTLDRYLNASKTKESESK